MNEYLDRVDMDAEDEVEVLDAEKVVCDFNSAICEEMHGQGRPVVGLVPIIDPYIGMGDLIADGLVDFGKMTETVGQREYGFALASMAIPMNDVERTPVYVTMPVILDLL